MSAQQAGGSTMSGEAIGALVRAKAADVIGVPVEQISDTTDLAVDFGIDSLELLEIGARVERALGTRISADDLVRARTIGEAIELLTARLHETPS